MTFSGEFWRDVSQPRGEPRCATLWALIKFAISSLSSLPFAHFRTFLLSFCSFPPVRAWKGADLGDFPRADLQAAAPGRNPARRTQLFEMPPEKPGSNQKPRAQIGAKINSELI